MAVGMFAPEAIDRVTPTLRPATREVMRHRWAELLFLHWIVPQEQLSPFLPTGLELDTFEGNAYIGLIPFTMTGIRPMWAPAFPPLSDFHEINLRTYVHRGGKDPGVWFFSLDAANAAAVHIARNLWKLPYHFARISLTNRLPAPQASPNPQRARAETIPNSVLHSEAQRQGTVFDSEQEEPCIEYVMERQWPGPTPATCSMRYTPHGLATPAAVGTLEHFLAERYILYAYRNGQLYSGQVNHVPYPLQQVTLHHLEENLIANAEIKRPNTAPIAHYAREVNVHVFPLKAVTSG